MEYSCVIPCFNEAEILPELCERLHDVMVGFHQPYEIILVDDKSDPVLMLILPELLKKDSHVKIVTLRNHGGQSAALFAGFRASVGKWIITLDGDLQNPPEEIPKLITYQSEYDFITGVRAVRQDTSLTKVSSALARWARRLVLGDSTADTGCSLRMFKREIVGRLIPFRNVHRFLSFFVRERGFSIKEVPVIHCHRQAGCSKYKTFTRLVEGLWDLWGVFWLKRRMLSDEI